MNIKYLFLFSSAIVLTGCSGRNKQSYNPPEPKRTDLTKSAMDSVSIAENSLRLTIMVQKESSDFPQSAVETLESKMLSITSKNGIAGYGGNPSWVFAALATSVLKDVTSTPPVKKVIKYAMNLYVANIVTGDVYGTYTTEIMGVGDSYEIAATNAMSSFKDSSNLQEMLQSAKAKIVSWYNDHSQQFISEVNDYINRNEYDKAYALLLSVPEEAEACFEYAQKHKDSVSQKYKKKQSAENYAKMIDEIAKAGTEYSPYIGGYLLLLPNDAPEFARAQKAYEEYLNRITKAAEIKSEREFYLEKERVAAQKMELEAQMKASEALQAKAEKEQSSSSGNSIVSQIVNQAVQLGVNEIVGFIF